MKKTVILSGPLASGKTHIAEAIAVQHKPDNILKTYYGDSLKKINNKYSLIIVEGIPKDRIRDIFNEIKIVNSKCNIVLTTQDLDVSYDEFGDFSLVVKTLYNTSEDRTNLEAGISTATASLRELEQFNNAIMEWSEYSRGDKNLDGSIKPLWDGGSKKKYYAVNSKKIRLK